MRTLAGVDGCPAGWVAALDRGGPIEIVVVKTLADLLAGEGLAVVAVDMPIGLTDVGPRQPDLIARRLLGPRRGTSVMPAPIRPAAYAATHAEATAIRRDVEGKGVAIQAYGIYRKVAEVDAFLRGNAEARRVVVEAHPEVSFALWNDGRPIVPSKKTAEGREIRRRLVESVFGPAPSRPPRGAAMDDVLDAFACLWTARRIAAGTAAPFPPEPSLDSEGLPMRIVA